MTSTPSSTFTNSKNEMKTPILLTLQVEVSPENKGDFVSWQGKFNNTIVSSPGFISLEFLLPSNLDKHWLIIQRFASQESADSWRNSQGRLELINELKDKLGEENIQEIVSDETSVREGITEVFVTQVSAQNEKMFQAWSAKIHQAEAKFPGFRGAYLQSPMEQGGHWITLLQFDTLENLNHWLNSSERYKLLKEADALGSTFESHRLISPFSGWFAGVPKKVPLWKQTMLILLVLFPVVMLELKFLNPLLTGYKLPIVMFIGNALSVSLISYPLMPLAIKYLNWWVAPKGDQNQQMRITILGTLFILALYLFEVLFFLWF